MKINNIVRLTVFTVILFLTSKVYPAGTYSGGDGLSPATAYRIASAQDMQEIGANKDDWDKYFILIDDPNLAEFTGAEFNIIGGNFTYFTGSFDGNGHTIHNFTYISDDTVYHSGLFSYIGKGGVVKNLGLVNVNTHSIGTLAALNYGSITNCYSIGSSYGSGLVGTNYGSITNCYSTVTVTGKEYVGGLVAKNSGSIINCFSTGTVTASGIVGGLVGHSSEGSITGCYSSCSVTGSTDASEAKKYVGGLVGWNSSGEITNCYSTGSVVGYEDVGGLIGITYNSNITDCNSTATVTGYEDVGGLIGHYSGGGSLTNCFTIATVSGEINVGGLIGRLWGPVTGCYSRGSVKGDRDIGGLAGMVFDDIGILTDSYSEASVKGNGRVGGLVGYLRNKISNCYSTGPVTGPWPSGGLVGHKTRASQVVNCRYLAGAGPDNNVGKPLSKSQMKQQSNFVGFDFTKPIWKMIRPGEDYPRLAWQVEYDGDIADLYGVDLEDLYSLSSSWTNSPEDLNALSNIGKDWLEGK